MEIINSFANKTNEEIHNIYKTIEENNDYMTTISQTCQEEVSNMRRLQQDVTRLLVRLISKTEYLLRFEVQLKDFLTGMHELLQRKLSPLIISEVQLRNTLKQVLTMPVPINHTTTHATQLDDMPDYLAISEDKSVFFEMSMSDFAMCTGQIFLSCPLTQGIRTINTLTCSSALYLQINPDRYCTFRVKEHAVTPNLLEVESGLALLSNIYLKYM